ncbi:SDR family oxidoreductase, partial [Brasilonema sp. CT11]|nr:SDR family oxidoreductase [Brasilonema sp. CT11]
TWCCFGFVFSFVKHSRTLLTLFYAIGHSQTGYLKETDFINRMLIGIINMAAFPEPLSSSNVEFTPVDYVTKAIIYLR